LQLIVNGMETLKLNLTLYSTSHCHLCEKAEALLADHSVADRVELDKVEITDDSALLELYEIKIPVLKRSDNGLEIAWPFSLCDIKELIAM
jgi:glutaredoxin